MQVNGETMVEPIFAGTDVPRYTQDPFPAYRYLPSRPDIPHPRRDPAGHSYGREEDYLPDFSEQDWHHCHPYLYGIDLFNHGYWWEAHEAWETVWLAAGQDTRTGQFIQGLIQAAAAQLKRFTGEMRGAQLLTGSAIARLSAAEGVYLGLEVAVLTAGIQSCLRENRGEFPQIRLIFPPASELNS